ncbi:MAG: ribonuclease HII [Bacilli bacterium]|jgi:ribonuclease HII|nr:ribonuclease HII [Bacilli bacterium]
MSDLFNYDLYYLKDYDFICGIDEVGRGSLAGPLVVCGVIMKYDYEIDGIMDSKKLSSKKREELDKLIKEHVYEYFILEVDVETIDKKNIYQATRDAMNEIANNIIDKNVLVLSDAMKLNSVNNISIIKGDATSYAIASASIVAKVYRDKLMDFLHLSYPMYDFKNNKGYGTKKHILALKEFGFIKDIHRESFEPVKSMCSSQIKFNFEDE